MAVDGAVVSAAAAIVAAIVWAVRVEGKVYAHAQQMQAHEKRVDEMREDLSYIRQRIDRALNGR